MPSGGRMGFRVAIAATVAVVYLSGQGTSVPAAAAVRLCEDLVSSGLIVGPTELEAKKNALTAWRAGVLKHGERYNNWMLAADKFLTCLPRQAGGFECIARARPCTIEQAPDRRHLREDRLEM